MQTQRIAFDTALLVVVAFRFAFNLCAADPVRRYVEFVLTTAEIIRRRFVPRHIRLDLMQQHVVAVVFPRHWALVMRRVVEVAGVADFYYFSAYILIIITLLAADCYNNYLILKVIRSNSR